MPQPQLFQTPHSPCFIALEKDFVIVHNQSLGQVSLVSTDRSLLTGPKFTDPCVVFLKSTPSGSSSTTMSVEAKLSRLSLDLKSTQSPQDLGSTLSKFPEKTPESWEDENADDTPVEAPGPSLKQITSNDNPAPPPPTPISPQSTDMISRKWEARAETEGGRPTPRLPGSSSSEGNEKRPEKTTSTANRMIAGALGIKAPKKTDEQRQYEKAIKEAEIKRKNREKEQREMDRLQDEKAKAAVWDE